MKHHSSSDGINGIRESFRTGDNSLGEEELNEKVVLKVIGQDKFFTSIIHTEVESSVDENTNNRDSETSVETSNTISLEDLFSTIEDTLYNEIK